MYFWWLHDERGGLLPGLCAATLGVFRLRDAMRPRIMLALPGQ